MKNSGRNHTVKSVARFVVTVFHRIEDALLVGMLLGMIGIAVAQIVLRNFIGSGFIWGELSVRIMVLWVGLFGAMAAGRDGNHINIDVLNRFLPERMKHVSNCVVELFTAAICMLMAYYGYRFVAMEKEYGGTVFAKVPTWTTETVIPVAFLVISLRYLNLSRKSLQKAFNLES